MSAVALKFLSSVVHSFSECVSKASVVIAHTQVGTILIDVDKIWRCRCYLWLVVSGSEAANLPDTNLNPEFKNKVITNKKDKIRFFFLLGILGR